MAKSRIGSGWRNSYEKDGPEGKSQHQYLSLSLDLGALGDLSLACFLNDRRENGTQPSHLLVHSANGPESERLYIGGAWEKTARESGNKYLFCKLELEKLGKMGPLGADFTGVEPIRCRIVSLPKNGDRSPDVAIFRVDSDFQTEDMDEQEAVADKAESK